MIKGREANIYFVVNGMKRHIVSSLVFAELGFKKDYIQVANDRNIVKIPHGLIIDTKDKVIH